MTRFTSVSYLVLLSNQIITQRFVKVIQEELDASLCCINFISRLRKWLSHILSQELYALR